MVQSPSEVYIILKTIFNFRDPFKNYEYQMSLSLRFIGVKASRHLATFCAEHVSRDTFLVFRDSRDTIVSCLRLKTISNFQALRCFWNVTSGDFQCRNKRKDTMENLSLNTFPNVRSNHQQKSFEIRRGYS